MFARPDVTGLAVILGGVSGGLVCRDYDDMAGYELWARDHPELASVLPTVQTQRGRHIYFRGPGKFYELNDGEYRGTSRQYTVLPPSWHPSGTHYRWLIGLPEGELPMIADPRTAGLLGECNTASAADTAHSDEPVPPQTPLLLAPAVLHAIASTLPTGPGQRNRRLFHLARKLKAIPELANADFPELRPIVAEWHRQALPAIATKDCLETWADFVIAWPRVMFAGDDVVEAAFARACAIAPPLKAVELYGTGPIVLLCSLCRELQRIAGEGQFFLDCRTAGQLVGVDHSTAWRWLSKVLCADGILLAGAKGSRESGNANEFKYIGG